MSILEHLPRRDELPDVGLEMGLMFAPYLVRDPGRREPTAAIDLDLTFGELESRVGV